MLVIPMLLKLVKTVSRAVHSTFLSVVSYLINFLIECMEIDSMNQFECALRLNNLCEGCLGASVDLDVELKVFYASLLFCLVARSPF